MLLLLYVTSLFCRADITTSGLRQFTSCHCCYYMTNTHTPLPNTSLTQRPLLNAHTRLYHTSYAHNTLLNTQKTHTHHYCVHQTHTNVHTPQMFYFISSLLWMHHHWVQPLFNILVTFSCTGLVVQSAITFVSAFLPGKVHE